MKLETTTWRILHHRKASFADHGRPGAVGSRAVPIGWTHRSLVVAVVAAAAVSGIIAFLLGAVVVATVRAGLDAEVNARSSDAALTTASLAPTAGANDSPVVAGRWAEPTERPEFSTPSMPAPTVTPGARSGASLPARSGHSVKGYAAWFATGPDGLFGAAGPALRKALGAGWRGRVVTVCASRCVTIRLNDWCLCRDRHGEPTVVDLSDEAFARLAPLSRGIVEVKVRW